MIAQYLTTHSPKRFLGIVLPSSVNAVRLEVIQHTTPKLAAAVVPVQASLAKGILWPTKLLYGLPNSLSPGSCVL
ncbi:unnamed protein product [Hermetia illucens]|uniref:Uncharacterized protein n=1 Tax=Hermetia illucens TaxID=343691 RepID=A0A7R8YY99_HERIL|nr:unnamed protein product [Hermetia illucens]